ncbi:uncharacterized protein LOC131163802 isoform X2 [Malania oleifera]|uniref:uncharacterized protein LOC131163802 isoform X2 n=1 Tax=Malania oleifera TaxID=397392 RepID=UPI0025AE6468|nr:uncharacterized protein LOC131163802 isoform X2 [Malania oleifera]
MEEEQPSRKRPFPEDEDLNSKHSAQKRVRFPKGKKVKPGEEAVGATQTGDGSKEWNADPRLAAKERANRRSQMTTELCSEEGRGILHDISAAEVNYEDNDTFVDDGIQIEPFNLEKEREEGYFDAEGNFVEYVNDSEIKDAWLDSVDVDPRFAEKASTVTSNEDDIDLSSAEIGKMKRRIADLLGPGETILQALKRLKGTSNSKKEKMPPEIKLLFDQLTEDAMKLMENGDYNVYHERQEVFVREAEGYERLAQVRGEGTSSSGDGNPDSGLVKDLFSSAINPGVASSVFPDTALGHSHLNASTGEISSSNGAETFDMFAEDDENITPNPSSDNGNSITSPHPDRMNQPLSEASNMGSDTGNMQNDYVYDESSGYSFNEHTGAYEEINEVASSVS